MKPTPEANFFKGLLLAMPIGLLMWALIIYGILELLS
jgi:hypothetical protein